MELLSALRTLARTVRSAVRAAREEAVARPAGNEREETKPVDEAERRLMTEQLQLATRLTGIRVWCFDLIDGRIDETRATFVNMWESLGYDAPDGPVDLLSTIARVVIEEDQEAVRRAIVACLDGETDLFVAEFRVRHNDGTIRWNLGRGYVTRAPSGKPLRFLGTSVDVTDLKRAEEEARKNKERFERAVLGSKACTWDFELIDGTLANSKATYSNVWELLGYEGGAPNNFEASLAYHFHSEDRASFAESVQTFLDGSDTQFEGAFRVRYRDGSDRWQLARGVVVRDPVTGRPLRFTGSSVDITDQKLMERALRESEERFRGMFENAAVGLVIIDAIGRIVEHNATLSAFLGHRGESLVGRYFDAFTFPVEVDAFTERYDRIVRGEISGASGDERYVLKDGATVWGHLTMSVIRRDGDGVPTHTLGVLQDISERKALDEELQGAREAAESANRAKDDFLANVSHEIRTPMNAVLGLTELALESAHTEHQKRLLSTVSSAAGNLLGIINDVLDFSKISAGKLTLDEEDFSLHAAVGDTVRALAARAHRKGLVLECYFGEDVPDLLFGDAGRLRQVLMNLVGNAIKFTAMGEIVVEVATVAGAPVDAPYIGLLFGVRDTGIGIEREKQSSVFRAFEQGDASTTRKYGGTGLGLTISAQLVELLGGTITVESEPGHGSTFEFTARFARSSRSASSFPPSLEVPERTPVPDAASRASTFRVLVAEDNELNVAVMQELLRQRGCVVDFASNGRDALAMAREGSHDLLLLDLHMPEMDGFEVVRRIRDGERVTGGHLPIIALTARSSSDDRERSLDAGMDDFLSKPIEVRALWAAIERLMAAYPARADAAGLLDWKTISGSCDGQPEMLRVLCEAFRRSLPGQMAAARASLDARESTALGEAAHRLRGTLASFSTVAGELAGTLEEAAASADLTSAASLVDRLEVMCTDLIAATRSLPSEGRAHAAFR